MKKLLFILTAFSLLYSPSDAMTKKDATRTASFIPHHAIICNRVGRKIRVRKIKIRIIDGSADYHLMINGEKANPNYFYILIRGSWVNVGCLLEIKGHDDDFFYLRKE